jgi:hypothetical protein
MAFNPMQQQQSPDMLMAMMTDPRATPQQRMAAMSALNTMRGGANAPTAAADDRRRHGCERHGPRVYGRCAPGNDGPRAGRAARNRAASGRAGSAAEPVHAALMSGAADASRVAAMAQGGAVKGYADDSIDVARGVYRGAKAVTDAVTDTVAPPVVKYFTGYDMPQNVASKAPPPAASPPAASPPAVTTRCVTTRCA